MKRQTRILVVFVGLLWAAFSAPALGGESPKALETVRKIVIDPGHGGENNGALGYNGVYEKDVALEIARNLRDALMEATDAEVLLTREEDVDVSLERRIEMANEIQADLFISLHCNSTFSRNPTGVETYVLSEKALEEESARLARRVVEPRGLYASASDSSAAAVVKEMLEFAARKNALLFAGYVQKRVTRKTGAQDRGVKELPIIVLRGAEMPAVVVEVGFLSNPKEAESLVDPKYQLRVVRGMVDSVIRYDKAMLKKKVPGPIANQPNVFGTN